MKFLTKIPLILMLLATLFLFVQLVAGQNVDQYHFYSQGTLYTNIAINKDGTVSPSNVPISRFGNNYGFTSDINGSITVETSNIIINGNGFTLKGWANDAGMVFG